MSIGPLDISMFLISAAQTGLKSQLDTRNQYIQYANANRQASLNNYLNYNSHTNLNSQQRLEMAKYGLDDFALKKQMRRELASSLALQASMGGIFGRTGSSVQATQNNIERHGYEALARKDLNFKTKPQGVFADYDEFLQFISVYNNGYTNVDLNTLSANNKAFSNLDSGPSSLGSFLEVAGTGLQIAANA